MPPYLQETFQYDNVPQVHAWYYTEKHGWENASKSMYIFLACAQENDKA